MGFRVGVSGFGFRASGLGFQDSDFGFRVSSFEFARKRMQHMSSSYTYTCTLLRPLAVSGFGFQGSGYGLQPLGSHPATSCWVDSRGTIGYEPLKGEAEVKGRGFDPTKFLFRGFSRNSLGPHPKMHSGNFRVNQVWVWPDSNVPLS